MLTLIYSQLIFCTVAYNFIYKGALGLSQYSFFLWYPLPLCNAFSHFHLICPHFSISICILVMFLPFSLPVHLSAFFPECIAFNLLLCFLFFQLFWGYLNPRCPALKSTLPHFPLQTLVPEVEVALVQVSPLGPCCPSQSTGEASLNTFALQFYPCWGM